MGSAMDRTRLDFQAWFGIYKDLVCERTMRVGYKPFLEEIIKILDKVLVMRQRKRWSAPQMIDDILLVYSRSGMYAVARSELTIYSCGSWLFPEYLKDILQGSGQHSNHEEAIHVRGFKFLKKLYDMCLWNAGSPPERFEAFLSGKGIDILAVNPQPTGQTIPCKRKRRFEIIDDDPPKKVAVLRDTSMQTEQRVPVVHDRATQAGKKPPVVRNRGIQAEEKVLVVHNIGVQAEEKLLEKHNSGAQTEEVELSTEAAGTQTTFPDESEKWKQVCESLRGQIKKHEEGIGKLQAENTRLKAKLEAYEVDRDRTSISMSHTMHKYAASQHEMEYNRNKVRTLENSITKHKTQIVEVVRAFEEQARATVTSVRGMLEKMGNDEAIQDCIEVVRSR